jgi:hypothetical protein
MVALDIFSFEFFGFPVSISVNRGFPLSYIIFGMNSRPVGGGSSETQSHPIDINNKNNTNV